MQFLVLTFTYKNGIVMAGGSALMHHPHLHCVVPSGGLSGNGKRWLHCRKGFLLPVRVLSRLFRRLFLEQLVSAHKQAHLQFFGQLRTLCDADVFATYLQPARAQRRSKGTLARA